ncbi:hypothetical protein ASD76_05570 [Altererythrobacter sp. Root672]|nr:hypothetical protein ASD76_05570 [Altererythrobacter sp. Root672]
MLTACSQGNGAPPPDPENLVECALAGAGAFERTCAIESSVGAEGLVLTVLHPQGGFRRFTVVSDGRTVSSADGAQLASVTPREDGIEVTVGLDRYRIPAKAMSHDAQ